MSERRCIVHPENPCSRESDDGDATCVCAPPGMSHDDRCGTRRGHKCNCAVAALAPDTAIGVAAFLAQLTQSPE